MGTDSTLIVAFITIFCLRITFAYPTFFQELIASNSHDQSKEKYYEDDSDAFKQHVNEASKMGKGTLIMKADEWKIEWCKAKSFNQTVRHSGCFSKSIENKYCYGQCNSIYIPGHLHLQGCNSCMPKSSRWVAVTLFCPFLEKKRKHKKVQMIYSCSCFDCPK